MTCNVFIPQLLWSARVRRSVRLLWVISIVVNIGMWLERYVIVVTSLHRDYLPSSWGMYHGTVWDYATFYGTLGLFLSLIFLFIRFLPVISITEMRELVYETQHETRTTAGPPGPVEACAMKTAPASRRSMACWPNSTSRKTWSPATRARLRTRLSDDGSIHPVSGGGAGRGARVSSQRHCRRRLDRWFARAESAAFSCSGSRPWSTFRSISAGGPTTVGPCSSRSRSS